MRNLIEVIILGLLLKLCFACQMPAYAIDKDMAIYYKDAGLYTHTVDAMNYLRGIDFDKIEDEKYRKNVELLFKNLLDIAHHRGMWMMDTSSFTSKILIEDYVYYCKSRTDDSYKFSFDWDTLISNYTSGIDITTMMPDYAEQIETYPFNNKSNYPDYFRYQDFTGLKGCNLNHPMIAEHIVGAGWKAMNDNIAAHSTSIKCKKTGKGDYFDTEKLECVNR